MNSTRAQFTEQLKKRGWCVWYSDKHTMPRLYNIHTQVSPITSLIKRYYQDHLRSTKQEDGDINSIEAYVLASLPAITATRFFPSDEQIFTCPRTGCSFANTSKKFEPKHEASELSQLFNELFERLFPNQKERTMVLQWIAHIIQRPLERPSWHLLLTSDTGTGKGFLYENILRRIIVNATLVNSYGAIFGDHSTVMESNLLIFLDDPKSNNDSTMTKLKSCLSEQTIYVNPKGITGYSTLTYARVILASNEKRPLRLDDTERRWLAPAYIEHGESREETHNFIQSLSAWLANPGSIEAVYNYFSSLDLSGFDHKFIGQTSTLESMVEQSKNAYEDALSDFLNERIVFKYEEIAPYLQNVGYSKPSDAAIRHWLAKNNYMKQRTRLSSDKQDTIWFPNTMSLEKAKATFVQTSPTPNSTF